MNDGMDDYGFDWSSFGSGCMHCAVIARLDLAIQ
jgi:hypothetical protein